MARREEWNQQTALARLLDKWLPAGTFWTATDATARSPMSGMMRRRRGVKAGVPDVLIYHGKLIGIEMKSRVGRCTPSQRAMRERILTSGGDWWVCRSARAAMWALAQSGVRFHDIERRDGTVERWQDPELPEWELPKRDPHERRPRAPDVGTESAAARKRRRLRRVSRASAGDVRVDDETSKSVTRTDACGSKKNRGARYSG